MSPRMNGSLLRLRVALNKAVGLSAADWWRVCLGQVALVRALRDVRNRPQGDLVRKDRPPVPAREISDSDRRAARAIAHGVSRAATHGLFSPTCLVKSMAISQRLEAEGIHGGILRVGVARRNGQFVAHAWVELGGEVIGDAVSAVERYEPLDDLQVTSRP